MPDPELKEWISLIKDVLLGLAALVTILVGVYGLKTWKRDLIGRELYASAKKLVKESHLIHRAVRELRMPLSAHETRQFTEEEIKHTTKNERWRLSESEGYKVRMAKFAEELERYQSAKLDFRVLVGSKAYEYFLPFDQGLTESLERVNVYLYLLQAESDTYFPDSPEIIEAQRQLFPAENHDDELSQSLADLREEAEASLLSKLHRKSIYG